MNKAIELTKQLIEIPSVSGDEANILAFLEDFLALNSAQTVRTKDFVAGLFENSNSDMLNSAKKAVVLTGHIDTVSAGELSGWYSSPWSAVETETEITGLGASDMKAGMAASLVAGIDFWQAQGETTDFDLWLVAVANEEIDGSGSAAFAEWLKNSGRNYDQIYGFIGEPTSGEQIEVGHRGNRFVNIEFAGISGHASQQANFAKSALAKASNFIAETDNIVADLRASYTNSILGAPSMVPTSLQAGDQTSPNKTAPNAILTLDIRTTPELDADFDNWLNSLATQFDFTWHYHSEVAPSCLISQDSHVVKTLLEAANLSQKAITVSPGATDQAFWVSGLGAEIVVFGPGDFSQAHRQNETITKAKIGEFYQVCVNFLKQI